MVKKILFRLILVAIVAGAAWQGYKYFQSLPSRQQQVATTRVRKGDVMVRTYSRGELRAVRSVTLTAPNLFGTVQVTQMAALGAVAREKDLIVEFDDSELLARIEEKQLELDQVDEQIKKAKADLAIRNNQDQVELLRTRYSVRRAELEVKRNELLSAIDAKKNLLNQEEARRRLKQLESDIKSRLLQAEAELAVLQERRNKAVVELQREKARLMQVKVLSPISGLVAIRQNRSGGFFFPGMQIPDIREGDQVQPGIPVADVLDLSELEVISRVGELDRANLKEDQEVIVQLDALPEARLRGKIKNMSGTASANVFSSDPAKKFDVVFSIDMRQLLSALGADKEQIDRLMATAEANRKKGVSANPFAFGGGGPMGAGGGMAMAGGPGGAGGAGGGGFGGAGGAMAAAGGPGGPGGGFGGQGGAGGGQGGPRIGFTRPGGGAGGGGGAFGGANLTDEQRTKMREVFQRVSGGKSPAEMTEQERADFQKKMQEEMKKLGIQAPAGGARPGAGGGERAARGEGGGEGAQGAGGGRRRGAGAGAGGGGAVAMLGGGGRFSQAELDSAKLPPPPEESKGLDVLLRPGMLADVEIIVEKIPDAIHIPAQALFERDGKRFVYLKVGEKFEERPVSIGKRTESTVVIENGLKAGDVVAMADPLAKPGANKKAESKGGAMGAIPMGGKK
ncbi:MAG: HlyD family efflux transporter periplasmic adaptor subunit [Bryobacteraceae bacterium]|nr:HlyD family efflux transporter periplasmic adaptor subunit [Bryobacteraceae bacterium]